MDVKITPFWAVCMLVGFVVIAWNTGLALRNFLVFLKDFLPSLVAHLPWRSCAGCDMRDFRILELEGELHYFCARVEGQHPDGPIKSERTYKRFKKALGQEVLPDTGKIEHITIKAEL